MATTRPSQGLVSAAWFSLSRFSLTPLAFSLSALLAFASGAYAQNNNGTWTNTNTTSADWTNTVNWSGGIYAGAIGTTTNTNTATFSSAVATPSSPILLSTNINLRGLTFGTGAGSYTIGTTNGGSLFMTASSTILITNNISASNTVITINSALVMYGGLTINNQASNGFGRFVIGGNISSGSASGTNTLALQSISTNSLNTNVITGLISDVTIGGRVGVSGSGSGGIWYLLNNSNSFSGILSINGGTVFVTSIRDRGINSAAGSGTTINIGSTSVSGNLSYIGTGDVNNRIINLAGSSGNATIVANGSGLLRFTTNFTANGIGSKALILSGTNAGEISGSIVDNSTTGSTVTTAAATNTNTLSLASVDGLTNGAIITGTNIATGTIIIGITNRVVTLSTATVGVVASGAIISNSALLNITSLTKNGSGTWTLSGSNSYRGTTTVSAGTLIAANSNALGASNGAITASGGILNLGANSFTRTGLITFSGGTVTNGTLSNNTTTNFAAQSGTVAAILAGSSGLTKSGTGTLTLSASNSYTGTTTLGAGVLSLGNANALAGGGTLTFTGGTLQYGPGITTGLSGLIKGSTAAISVDSGANVITYASVIDSSNVGGLTKSGAGTLTLSRSDNSFTGSVTITAGTLSVTSVGMSGSSSAIGAGNQITIGAGTTASTLNSFGAGNTTDRQINLDVRTTTATINNNGLGLLLFTGLFTNTAAGQGFKTLTLGGTNSGEIQSNLADAVPGTAAANTTFSIGATTITLGSTNGITNGSPISGPGIAAGTTVTNFGGANQVVLSQGLTGTLTAGNLVTNAGIVNPMGLTKTGAGTWTLSGSNSYSGTTTVSAGTLVLGNANALGAISGSLVVTNGILDLNGYSITKTSVTGAAAGVITNSSNTLATLTITNVASVTNASTLAGNLALLKRGSGTLTLSGSNSYTGATTVSEGQLILGNRFALSGSTFAGGAGSLSFGSLSRFTFGGLASSTELALTNRNGAVELTVGANNANTTTSGSITGSGALTKIGSGTLTLSASNSYQGGTILDQGGLSISNNDAFGTGNVTVNDNSTITALANLTVTNSYIINFGATATLFTANNWTNSGIISGQGGLIKGGSGNLTLTGANDYFGGTIINQGGLSISNNAAFGWGAVTVASNSTISALTNLTVANDYVINSVATATFFTTNLWTNAGSIRGGGTLTKAGTGTLTLTGENTYSGGTRLEQGGISISNSNAFGTGTVTVASNSTITALANLTVTNAYVINFGATATFSTANNWTNSGAITGNGSLTKTGAGTLTLTNNNTYTGTTTVSAGRLTLLGSNSLGDASGPIRVTNTGTLDLGSNSFTRTGLITFAGGTVTNGTLVNNTTTNFAGQSGTVAAILAGRAGLTKTGTGVLTLTGTNTYTNLTTRSEGGLSIFNSNTLAGWGSTNYEMRGGGALAFGGGFSDEEITNAVYNSGKFEDGASFGFDTASGTNRTFTNIITDTDPSDGGGILGLAKVGTGTLTLPGRNIYSGPTTIYAGTLRIGNSDALGTGTLVFNGGALSSVNTSNLTITNNFSFVGNGALGSTDTNNNGELLFTGGGNFGNNTNNKTITVNSAVTMIGDLTDNFPFTSVFIKSGVGTLTLTGENTYSGGTTLNQGGVSINNNSALGTGVVTVASNSTITALANLTFGNDFVLNSNSTATFSTTNLWTISGSITGAGGLNKTGSGTLILYPTLENDYTGRTTVSAGTLIALTRDSLGSSNSPLTVSGGTLDLEGNSFTRTGLITFAGGTVTNGSLRNNTTTNFAGNSGVVAAILEGTAGLTKSGSGTLILSTNNFYEGGTLVTNGTLIATNSSLAFGRSGVTNSGGVIDLGSRTFTNTFALESGTITNGTISNTNFNFTSEENGILAVRLAGSGSLTKGGSGTLTLAESNSYTRGTLVSDGTLIAANANALSTNTVSVQGSGALLDLGRQTFTNTFAITGGTITNGTISNNANFTLLNDGVIGAVIAGSGTLIKGGSGTLTLAAPNSYTGGTVISNGILTVADDSALGSTRNNLDIPSGSLSNTAFRVTVQALTIGNGTITGSGTITAISYTATNSRSALIQNSLAGNVGLMKGGAGTLTLSGSNTYSGGTTISAGTINANNSNALGTGALTMNNEGVGLAVTNRSTALMLGNGININNAATITLGPRSSITNTGAITISGVNNIINLTTNWNFSAGSYPLMTGTNLSIASITDSISLTNPVFGLIRYGTTTNVGAIGLIGGTNYTFRSVGSGLSTSLTLIVDVPPLPIEAYPTPFNASIPAAAFDGGVKAISVSPTGISSSLNGNGQVVVWNRSTTITTVPNDLSNGVTAISAGYSHMMALKNGRVTTWGNITTPTPPRALSGVVAISAGTDSLALRQDGTVVGWGGKYLPTDPYGAVRIISVLTNAVGISDGDDQGLVLLADGTVVGFGRAFGSSRDAYIEVRSLGLTNVAAVSEGNNFAMALKKDGSVVAWGNNSINNVPTGAMSGVISISAGWNYAVALKNDGSVVAWGDVPANLPTNSIQATAVEAGTFFLLIGRQNIAGRALDDCQTSGGLQNNPFINNGGSSGRILPIPRVPPNPRDTPSRVMPSAVAPPARVPPPPR